MSASEKAAYIFPGQGAQAVGMGHDIYDTFESARGIFDQADKVLDFPLTRLCFEGPEEELRLTINAQPALVTMSYAILTVIRETAPDSLPEPAYMAGHSLGEYTALAAAGALDFSTTVHLARERGRLMHEAGLKQTGGMVAVIGLEEDLLNEVCNKTNTRIANFNSPGQMVISGPMESMPAAAELALARGANRVIPLQVSGAFHSPLMQPAQEGLSEIIANAEIRDPAVPIVANTTAQPLTSAGQLREELNEQLCNPVQWQRTIEFMISKGVSTFYEIGPGKVLAGLNKRIDRDIITHNINDALAITNLSR
ncbi:MAG: ACP S-malonyltransferase [Dehalococcoidales bacterium]